MGQGIQTLKQGYGRKNIVLPVLFGAFFLVWLFILHGLPLSLDDYGFRGTSFSSNHDALQWVLGYGNGRLLGNGGIIFLLHHQMFGTLVRPLVLAGIVILLPAVLHVNRLSASLFAMFLIMSIAPGIFGQSISWMSGFQNYVPPVFLFLSGTCFVQLSAKAGRLGTFLCSVTVFLIGLAMQFYIEHSSCLNFLMALALMLFVWKKNNALPCRITAGCFSLGALLGLAALLLITGRSMVGHVSYLSDGFSGLVYGIMRNGVEVLGMLSENSVLLLCLTALLLLLMRRHQNDFSAKEMKVSVIVLVLTSLFLCTRIMSGFRSWYGKLIPAETILTSLCILLWFFWVFFVLIRLSKREKTKRLRACIVMFIFALAGLVPLLLIWPIGYRCLFHSYILLCAGALLLLEELVNETDSERYKTLLKTGLCCLVCISSLTMGTLFTDIRKMNHIREDFIAKMAQNGAETVETFNIPSPYVYEVWNEEYEHYTVVEGRRIRLKILPADVWFRLNYYNYS